jgi:enamine deaminase RidA (YjgF/YER057c/UK114 family)
VVVGEGDVEAQARRSSRSGRALAAAGAGAGDVAKVTVFLLDIDDRPRINPVRQEFFGATRPVEHARAGERPGRAGALLEVEAVAHVPA